MERYQNRTEKFVKNVLVYQKKRAGSASASSLEGSFLSIILENILDINCECIK